jgi:hypothetical protein
VLPLSAGARAAMGLSFTILDFPPADLSVVYLEHLKGDVYPHARQARSHRRRRRDVRGDHHSP